MDNVYVANKWTNQAFQQLQPTKWGKNQQDLWQLWNSMVKANLFNKIIWAYIYFCTKYTFCVSVCVCGVFAWSTKNKAAKPIQRGLGLCLIGILFFFISKNVCCYTFCHLYFQRSWWLNWKMPCCQWAHIGRPSAIRKWVWCDQSKTKQAGDHQ